MRYGFHNNGINIAFADEGLEFTLSQQEEVRGAQDVDGSIELLRGQSGRTSDYIRHTTSFTVRFDGANEVTAVGLGQSESRFNYYVGDVARHQTNVASYTTVAYEGIYNGVDLHTFGRRDSLKYEFYVAPGADYQQISVSYNGIGGLWIDEVGALHVETELGNLVDAAPYIYQVVDGQEVEVTGAFSLVDNDTYTFEITGDYDPNLKLVIDPDLAWSSYLGGSSADRGRGIAVDESGNVLITGETTSSGWVSGGWDPIFGGGTFNHDDAFVVKLSSNGQHLWSTYLGGSDDDSGRGIVVDGSGNILVTGHSFSFGWVSGGYNTNGPGGFVVKLASNGGHLWSTYVGGTGPDTGQHIAVDGSGDVYVTGETQESGWVSGGWDTIRDGDTDGYVVKLSGSGAHLWSTYIGGNNNETGHGIAADESGNVLVTGSTGSLGWVSGGWDTELNGNSDGFVVKLSNSGAHLWSTYIGGNSNESVYGIAADESGNVLVTGNTNSLGWVSGGWDTSQNGSNDAFVLRLSSTGGHVWSSYLGGTGSEIGRGIAVDGSGNVVVTGETGSSGWVSGGWDMSLGGTKDAFVLKLSSGGGHQWSSYLGGSSQDRGMGIALDGSGNVFVTGDTESSGWVSGGWDTSLGGAQDGFVAKITMNDDQPGDFNGDGLYDRLDIDALVAEIAAGSHDAAFDINDDDLVNLLDRDAWLATAGAINLASRNAYLLGDANLDGVVDVADFNIWNSHRLTLQAAWSAGDFNADGAVDVSDFNIWNSLRFMSALSDGESGSHLPKARRQTVTVMDHVLRDRDERHGAQVAPLEGWSAVHDGLSARL